LRVADGLALLHWLREERTVSYENYAPPRSRVEEVPEASGADAPALWLPSTTANIALVFPIALCAWLQQRNWEAMGRPVQARRSRLWMIADAVFLAAWLIVPRVNPTVAPLLVPISFVLVIAWYYASAKPQIRYVAATYGKHYPRRNWGPPLLAGLAMDVIVFAIGGWA
jgi:hypothetical protein